MDKVKRTLYVLNFCPNLILKILKSSKMVFSSCIFPAEEKKKREIIYMYKNKPPEFTIKKSMALI